MGTMETNFNAFEYAKLNANPSCSKCAGTGRYQYTTHGTPHFTICDLCCKHDKGYWQLKEWYKDKNNMWCCLAGCGHLLERNPDAG